MSVAAIYRQLGLRPYKIQIVDPANNDSTKRHPDTASSMANSHLGDERCNIEPTTMARKDSSMTKKNSAYSDGGQGESGDGRSVK
jgi:hypothetical protein